MTHRPFPSLLTLALAALLGAAPGLVQAQAAASWYARASLAFLHDTNYLRLADGQATPAGYAKADTVLTGTLAAGFDQRFGTDQRAYARAEMRSNRVANNSMFDNQGWRLVAGLDWRTAGAIAGEMRVFTDRSLAAFETGTTGVPASVNLITLNQADALFRIGYTTGFNAEAALGWREVDYSAALYDSREYHEGWASAGVRYRPTERSSIGLSARSTRGSFPRYRALAGGGFQSDDYTGRYIDLTATYTATGKSELRARLSSGRTTHDNAVQSDFSGLTGSLDWRWLATSKLTLTTTLTREPSQDAFFLASGASAQLLEYTRVSTAMRLGADYAATARIRLRASIEATHRDLSQSLPLPGGSAIIVNGSDRLLVGSLGATWQPTRLLSLGCDIGHELRRGQPPLSADITASRLGCQVQVSLEGRPLEGR
jgi:hypothetical protein